GAADRLAVARVMIGAEHAEVGVAGRHAALELLEAARVDVAEGLDRAHWFLLLSFSSVETPDGFEPSWHGLQPCASPLGHGVVEPPRGVEPLLAGSKPAALSSELRRRCSAGRRRLCRRRFQPSMPGLLARGFELALTPVVRLELVHEGLPEDAQGRQERVD